MSVILMPAGQTSVQHLVMLHSPPRPCSSRRAWRRSRVSRGVHVQFGVADEVPRSGVGRFVVLVVTDDVAHVLAQPALDALAELLAAADIGLPHPHLAGFDAVGRGVNGSMSRALR